LEKALEDLPEDVNDHEYWDPLQEEEFDDIDGPPKSAKSSAYKPENGSVLHQHLINLKKHVMEGSTIVDSPIRKQVLERGHYYVEDLLYENWMQCLPSDPKDAYLRHIRIFCWMPLRQHRKKIKVQSISQCKCVHCGKVGKMEACEYDWKPFFYFDKIVWVFFLRDRCSSKRGGCGKTCSQIDPRFLSTLPSSVAREFPFVSAGSRRIGMALPMLYSFIEMIGNGIQVGAFAWI
jgi:hypothetical protein